MQCWRLWCINVDGAHKGCRTQHTPWADGTECEPGKVCNTGGLSLVALFPWVQAEDISQNHPTLMPVKWGMALTAVVEAQSSSMCFKPGGAWAISSPDIVIKVGCLA